MHVAHPEVRRDHRVAIELDGGSPRSVRQVREFVRQVTAVWLPGPQVADLETIASELATNAIEHTGSSTIVVRIAVSPVRGWVTLSVTDQGPRRRIAVQAADAASECGRGLQIVTALSQRWGHASVGRGTCVWARIAIPEAPSTLQTSRLVRPSAD